MKLSDIRVCVLRIEGTNCEQEMYDSFRRLGARPEIVHLNQLIRRGLAKDMHHSLFDYHLLMIPGGFSAGDYIRAGAIWAALLKSKLKKELNEFVRLGYPIGGVCNGFQVLVELGLLPGLGAIISEEPQAVLGINDSGRFECRPTYLKLESRGNCVFTHRLRKKIIMAPSAHAEGKLMFPRENENRVIRKLFNNDQIVFRYVDPDGNYAGYPWNPNGSPYNIAGICNPGGTVFGMMPHPERVFYRWQHYLAPTLAVRQKAELGGFGDGKYIFESVLDYVSKKF
jgi:phosphoribosylformylglycinamidine synthase